MQVSRSRATPAASAASWARNAQRRASAWPGTRDRIFVARLALARTGDILPHRWRDACITCAHVS